MITRHWVDQVLVVSPTMRAVYRFTKDLMRAHDTRLLGLDVVRVTLANPKVVQGVRAVHVIFDPFCFEEDNRRDLEVADSVLMHSLATSDLPGGRKRYQKAQYRAAEEWAQADRLRREHEWRRRVEDLNLGHYGPSTDEPVFTPQPWSAL